MKTTALETAQQIAGKLLWAAETSAMSVSWDPVNGWRFDFGDVFAGIPMADDDPVVNGRLWPERKLVPCGTATAFKRHKSRGEDPCRPCTVAMHIYDRERKRRKREREREQERHLKAVS